MLNQIRAAFIDWAYQAAQMREPMLNKTTIAQAKAKATAANMEGPGYMWASKPRQSHIVGLSNPADDPPVVMEANPMTTTHPPPTGPTISNSPVLHPQHTTILSF